VSRVFEFECKKCGEPSSIGNPDFITGITGLDEEDIKYCEDHMGEFLEGVTIDIGGVMHTRSEAFRTQREQRQRDDDDLEVARRIESVDLVDVFYDDSAPDEDDSLDEFGWSVVVEQPKLANADLKELGWQATHRRWSPDEGAWLADADRVGMIRDHMSARGWTVNVVPAVRGWQGE